MDEKRRQHAVPALLLAAAAAICTALSPVGLRLERYVLDFHAGVLARFESDPGDEPVIVALDDISFDVMAEEMNGLAWPYPRAIHAQTVSNLLAAGAKAVFLDILFDLPSGYGEQDDRALAAVLGSGKVLLAGEDTTQAQTRPLPLFSTSGGREVNVALPLDIDGMVRWAPGAATLPRNSQTALFHLLGLEYERPAARLPGPAAALISEKSGRKSAPAGGGLIDFGRGRGRFKVISYFEVYNPVLFAPRQSEVAGKLVFIGSTPSASVTPEQAADVFFTPAGPMPGVEIHAHHYASLAAGTLRRVAIGWPVALTMLAWLLIQCRGALAFNSPRGGLLFALASLFICEAAALLLLSAGHIIPVLLPLSLVVFLYVTGLGLQYLRERDARLLTRAQLFHYLPARVAEHVLANPGAMTLGGERKVLTVLFADVAGFTTLSERYSAEEVVALLQAHLREMAEAIFNFQGTLDKYLGDGIMAFWGAPQAQENHADLALAAARDMLARVDRQNAERRANGVPELVLRIGLHSGEAIVGNIGSELFIDYTAIGDTVNTAARLEGVNKLFGTTLMVSEDTAAALSDGPDSLISLGRVAVKGRAAPTAVSTLTGTSAGEQPVQVLESALALLEEGQYEEAKRQFSLLQNGCGGAEKCFNSVAEFHLQKLEALGAPARDGHGKAYWPLDSK